LKIILFYQMPDPLTSLRADKYLHHVRLFKTRSLATQACDKGHVKLGDTSIKPARDLRAGDTLTVKRSELEMTIRVTALPPTRVGAPLVKNFFDDLTPVEVYERAADIRRERAMSLPRTSATPMTKKDMRTIRRLLGRE
jgi:ribosome-associated heat shock protein Hsp15